jgi:hypothetical protein
MGVRSRMRVGAFGRGAGVTGRIEGLGACGLVLGLGRVGRERLAAAGNSGGSSEKAGLAGAGKAARRGNFT